jgi:hypothetical protein
MAVLHVSLHMFLQVLLCAVTGSDASDFMPFHPDSVNCVSLFDVRSLHRPFAQA